MSRRNRLLSVLLAVGLFIVGGNWIVERLETADTFVLVGSVLAAAMVALLVAYLLACRANRRPPETYSGFPDIIDP